MDKRYVGRWQRVSGTEIIDIFDEEPPSMKLSFPENGYYNYPPNKCYFNAGRFCYEINDEYYRMVYSLIYEDGRLRGHYTQFGIETEIAFELCDSVPRDEPEYFKPTKIAVPESEKIRSELLHSFAAYDRSAHYDIRNEYILGESLPPELEDYGYSEFISGYDGDELAIRLLLFVTKNFNHNGSIGMPPECSARNIIKFCRDKGAVNCRGLAILLASLLRMNGFRARHITCMPYEEPFNDCHVVVDCELKSGDRIMLDPTWGLYLCDETGGYVSLPDLRCAIIDGRKLVPNPEANYNGELFDYDGWLEYMTKNCFRFDRSTTAADGVDGFSRTNRMVELIPVGYPVDGFTEAHRERFMYNDLEFWKM